MRSLNWRCRLKSRAGSSSLRSNSITPATSWITGCLAKRQAPAETVPIASLDTGLNFERIMSGNSSRVQTIEPRLLYVHVPFRDQDDLPVFDTILPDLNLVSLYRENRFLGVDRIADTDQLSIGVTTRILETGTGRELMSATIGQARYLSGQRVTLPGQTGEVGDSSDYIAEMRFLVWDDVNFDVGHQWSDEGTTRSEARLQYRPASNKILNLAYRFRRGSLEQGDVSWSWPITQSWNFVGRYNFSLRDNETLEEFLRARIRELLLGTQARWSSVYLNTRRNPGFFNRSATGTEGNDQCRLVRGPASRARNSWLFEYLGLISPIRGR